VGFHDDGVLEVCYWQLVNFDGVRSPPVSLRAVFTSQLQLATLGWLFKRFERTSHGPDETLRMPTAYFNAALHQLPDHADEADALFRAALEGPTRHDTGPVNRRG
jgi:hypothetical protein